MDQVVATTQANPRRCSSTCNLQVASYKERSNRNEVITSVGQTIEGTGGHIDVAISHATVRDTAEAAVGVQGSFRHMFTTNEQVGLLPHTHGRT